MWSGWNRISITLLLYTCLRFSLQHNKTTDNKNWLVVKLINFSWRDNKNPVDSSLMVASGHVHVIETNNQFAYKCKLSLSAEQLFYRFAANVDKRIIYICNTHYYFLLTFYLSLYRKNETKVSAPKHFSCWSQKQKAFYCWCLHLCAEC